MGASGQEEGLLGRFVGGMIRRTVRARFRNVYWDGPMALEPPVVFAANHHGWHDGYLMFHFVTALRVRTVDWIAEFGAFPLFAKIGGMPFPPGDASARAATLRRTIRLMREDRRSLCIFPEGVLHPGPELLPYGRALDVVLSKVPGATLVPVAIHYAMGMHERPEAWLRAGAPLEGPQRTADDCRSATVDLLRCLREDVRAAPDQFTTLAKGTPDVNERWDARKLRGGR